jgi:hypothetical protein
MNFKSFIYYCALCGGWAAFIAWAVVAFTPINRVGNVYTKTAMIAAVLGLLVAGVVGMLDALLNSVGAQRMVRIMLCLGIGFFGSMVGGLVGQSIREATGKEMFMVVGWIIVGIIIGISIGVFDLLRAAQASGGMGQATRKIINGIIGGTIGGALGGTLNYLFLTMTWPVAEEGTNLLPTMKDRFERFSQAAGLVILGACIGLLIGLAQVLLKEAWVRVEQGFRAGREMILSKPDTTVGRAESCDIGLFGDNGVEKLHAHIVLKNGRYVLLDSNTPGGTYLNGSRIGGPTPLSSGDTIGVGRNVLRFEERAKRR